MVGLIIRHSLLTFCPGFLISQVGMSGQFRDVDFLTVEILDIETREKIKKHQWDFSYLQRNYSLLKFHVNLEYYILGSQIS